MKYILYYFDGSFVKVDNSTGPMSTGGYPYSVKSVWDATHWETPEAAFKYAAMFKGQIEQRAYPVEVNIHPPISPQTEYQGKHRLPVPPLS